MSLDLTLLPIEDGVNWSHTVLPVPQDSSVFRKIQKLPSMEIDDGFYSYLSSQQNRGSHYGETMTDGRGYRLKWVLAKGLKTVGIQGPVGAFVAAMGDRDRVALYWH